jgi:CheY-like chemotaxis protein
MAFFSKWFSRTSPAAAEQLFPLTETPFDDIKIEPGLIQGHILVVDDEPIIVDMMRRVLEARGYTVETANNGEEALDKMQENLPDLFITDIMMPEMGGWELIHICKKDSKFCNMAIIAITVRSADKRADDMLTSMPKSKLGVDIWLIKPLNPQKLVETVDRVLGPS